MYTGLYEYWRIRLSDGKYVFTEIKKQLDKAYFVESAITENEYHKLITYARDHASPTYTPNATLEELQKQNALLETIIEQQASIINQQKDINAQQDEMIITILENGGM